MKDGVLRVVFVIEVLLMVNHFVRSCLNLYLKMTLNSLKALCLSNVKENSDDDGECCYIVTAICCDILVGCNDEDEAQNRKECSSNNMNSIYSYMIKNKDNNVNSWGILEKRVIHIYRLFHLC